MSGLIKSLAVLIAIVGLAVASYAGRVNVKPRDNIPGSLSELGYPGDLWKVLRKECKAFCAIDKAIELLKIVDNIYAALDDDAKIKLNDQKIVEQFEINRINGAQFCAGENLEELAKLSNCFHVTFSLWRGSTMSDNHRTVGNYLHERGDNFAFVCRSYALKNLDKRVGEMNEMYRHDMETTLGNKLVLLRENRERLVQSSHEFKRKSMEWTSIDKISPKWMDVLLEFFKEKSGNNLDAKSCITTGDEGRQKFNKLFEDSVVDMCQSWRDATREAREFEQRDERQRDDYTEKQASWMEYADVCGEITFNPRLLAESMYIKMGGKSSEISTAKPAKKGFKALF